MELQHYHFRRELKAVLRNFIAYSNIERHYESRSYVTSANCYFGPQLWCWANDLESSEERWNGVRKKYLARKRLKPKPNAVS